MAHKNILMYCFRTIFSFTSMGKSFYFIVRVHSASFSTCWLYQRLTENVVGKSQFRNGEQLPEANQHSFECYFLRFTVTMYTKYPNSVHFCCFSFTEILCFLQDICKWWTGRDHFIVFWLYALCLKRQYRKPLSCFNQKSPDLHFDLY